MKKTVAVIGGGAAGLLAAGTAAQNGAHVLLFEKNPKVGRKLYITGKGRCNVTNHCDKQTVLANIPCNPRFLYSAIEAFPPAAVMTFFESQGVPLKIERGNRVFPVSDRSADIIDALFRFVKKQGVEIIQQSVSKILIQEEQIRGVETGKGKQHLANRVIIATGGASYPLTGSTGDGYELAEALGHTVIAPRASLVPLVEAGKVCQEMMGLSLRNVRLTILEGKKKLYQEQGEMLFTHFGLSGPLILSASAHMRKWGTCTYTAEIDLKPALDEKMLNIRVLADFEKYQNHDFINALGDLLPRKMIPVIVRACSMDPHKKVHSITKEERRRLLYTLKHLQIEIAGTRPLDEAIITSGGVAVREVSPKTMESKRVAGLFFAGEVLDVDAYTGGFNLQIAWSTGFVAGQSAAR